MLAALLRELYVNIAESASPRCEPGTGAVPREQPASSYGEDTLVCPEKGSFTQGWRCPGMQRCGRGVNRVADDSPGVPGLPRLLCHSEVQPSSSCSHQRGSGEAEESLPLLLAIPTIPFAGARECRAKASPPVASMAFTHPLDFVL